MRCVFALTLEGGPAVFWCCAALQCISPPVLSSPAVGCRKKITSQCHCWFIKLNCFLLLCVLCLSGTSWECLEPECHSLKQGTQHWSVLLKCLFNVITVSFVGNLYSPLSVKSLAMTSRTASLSVFIEEQIMTNCGKMFIFLTPFSLSWFLYDYLCCLYILNHHVRVIDFKILYFSQKVNRLFTIYCMVLCCFFTEIIKRFQTYHPILQIKIKLTTSNEKSDPVRQVFQFQGP